MQIQNDGMIIRLPLFPSSHEEGIGGVKFFKASLTEDKSMRAHKGQSTVEYILLITAVIAVIVLFTAGNGSLFQTRLTSVFNSTTQDMLNVASFLQQNAAP